MAEDRPQDFTALAVINVSDASVETSAYTIPPKGKIRVRDYYRDAAAFRQDVSLKKYLARNKVVVSEVDWAGIQNPQAGIAAAEERDAEERRAIAAEFVRRKAERRALHSSGSLNSHRAAEEERAIRVKEVEVRRLDELQALYERGRKDRLARARARSAGPAIEEQAEAGYREQVEQLTRERAYHEAVKCPECGVPVGDDGKCPRRGDGLSHILVEEDFAPAAAPIVIGLERAAGRGTVVGASHAEEDERLPEIIGPSVVPGSVDVEFPSAAYYEEADQQGRDAGREGENDEVGQPVPEPLPRVIEPPRPPEPKKTTSKKKRK